MNRRELLIAGGSLGLAAITPPIAFAASAPAAAAFVPPTTNTISLAGRIAHACKFKEDDLLKLLGLDPRKVACVEEEDVYDFDIFNADYRNRMKVAHSLAEAGDLEIYKRADAIIGIKRKLNLHFNFNHSDQMEWLDEVNPHLEDMTFRELMNSDLEFASEVIDQVLQG